MIDIKLIRQNPEVVKQSMKKRFLDAAIVDELVDIDKKLNALRKKVDELRHQRNIITLEITKLVKQGEKGKIAELVEQGKQVDAKLKEMEQELNKLAKQHKKLWMSLPNLVADDVPVGDSDKFNKVVTQGIEPKTFSFKPRHHAELIEMLGADIERAGKVAGARFFYLTGKLAKLALALQAFALDFLIAKGYTPIIPPYMLRKKAYEGVIDFGAFEEMIYKIEGEDLYAIATAEHPIAAMYMNETINVAKPLKFAGLSPCFRKEAGAHGKDTKGIFRVHQFEKVEQFVFCKHEDATQIHEELRKNGEEILKQLGLPYRTVIVCSGEMSKVAYKQYDFEVYFPSQQCYRELGSCSNCLDWQARRLNIKYNTGKQKAFVYTLNATALAIERAITAIIENYQQEDASVVVPKVLQNYTGFDVIEPVK